MQNKISTMLDAVAEKLEAKGLIKEALEIDKVADAVDCRISSAEPMDETEIKKYMYSVEKPYVKTYDQYITLISDSKKYDAMSAFLLDLQGALHSKDIKKAKEMYDTQWPKLEKHTFFDYDPGSRNKTNYKRWIEDALNDPSQENLRQLTGMYNDFKDYGLGKTNRHYDPKHISEGRKQHHLSERPWYS